MGAGRCSGSVAPELSLQAHRAVEDDLGRHRGRHCRDTHLRGVLLCATHRPVHPVPMRGDLLQRAGSGQSGRFEPLDDLFDLRQPRLEGTELVPNAVQLLGKNFGLVAPGRHCAEPIPSLASGAAVDPLEPKQNPAIRSTYPPGPDGRQKNTQIGKSGPGDPGTRLGTPLTPGLGRVPGPVFMTSKPTAVPLHESISRAPDCCPRRAPSPLGAYAGQGDSACSEKNGLGEEAFRHG